MRTSFLVTFALLTTPAAPAFAATPAGYYVKHRAGNAEMWVRQVGGHWRVSIDAGGIPDGANTAADCPAVADGRMIGHRFVGEFKYFDEGFDDAGKWRFNVDTALAPGSTVTIVFKSGSATVSAHAGDFCSRGNGVNGRYHLKRHRR
jgi:hypothetical protein